MREVKYHDVYPVANLKLNFTGRTNKGESYEGEGG